MLAVASVTHPTPLPFSSPVSNPNLITYAPNPLTYSPTLLTYHTLLPYSPTHSSHPLFHSSHSFFHSTLPLPLSHHPTFIPPSHLLPLPPPPTAETSSHSAPKPRPPTPRFPARHCPTQPIFVLITPVLPRPPRPSHHQTTTKSTTLPPSRKPIPKHPNNPPALLAHPTHCNVTLHPCRLFPTVLGPVCTHPIGRWPNCPIGTPDPHKRTLKIAGWVVRPTRQPQNHRCHRAPACACTRLAAVVSQWPHMSPSPPALAGPREAHALPPPQTTPNRRRAPLQKPPRPPKAPCRHHATRGCQARAR